MKRIFLLVLLGMLFMPCLLAQQRNPMLQNTVPMRRGNIVVVDRWNAELRMSDITYENFRQLERNVTALQRTTRDFQRTVQNQDRLIREQQRTIETLNRRLATLERDVNTLRRR
ncbi:MAG: hypothetical protein FWC10_07125 [Lentimicrobiaceae bacterium]|nr:hypothetical protein [Lentimicrobiaceae bacterium]